MLTLFTYPYVLPAGGRPPRRRCRRRSRRAPACSVGRPWAVFRTVVLPQVSGAIGPGTLLVFLYTRQRLRRRRAPALRHADPSRSSPTGSSTRTRRFALGLVLGVLALVGRGRPSGPSAGAGRRTEVGPVARRPLQVPLGRWRWPALAWRWPSSAPRAWSGRWPSSATGRCGGSPRAAAARLADDLGELADAHRQHRRHQRADRGGRRRRVVLPVAYLTARYRTAVGGAANTFVVGGFALPGLVIALSLVFWTLSGAGLGGLYQTFAAAGLRLRGALRRPGDAHRRRWRSPACPRRLDDAARMLGAGRVRRFVTDRAAADAARPAGRRRPGAAVDHEGAAGHAAAARPPASRRWPPGSGTPRTTASCAEVGLASLVLRRCCRPLLTWLLVVRRAERFA